MPNPPRGVLDKDTIAFVQKGVSMLAASRTLENVPHVARVWGCKVFDDLSMLIYLPTSRSRPLLEAIAATGAIAVVFSEIASHKTTQIKAEDARIIAVAGDSAAVIRKYSDAFVKALTALGYTSAMARALCGVDASDVTGVVFTPCGSFDQTPGPGAGKAVVPR